jgi:hypothetical protein
MTAAWLQSGSESFTLIKKRTEVSAVVVVLLAVLAIGMTGTVAALGDTIPRNIAPLGARRKP